MTMTDIDLTDPRVRAEHFKPRPGRPPIKEIVEEIVDVVLFVAPRVSTDDAFISNELLHFTRLSYPGQGVYIGLMLSHLVRCGKVPLKRVGTVNRRALYAFNL